MISVLFIQRKDQENINKKMGTKSLFLLSALVLLSACSDVYSKKLVVCYQGTWATYRHSFGKFDASHIDPTLCTHIMYAFFGIELDGQIRIIDPYLDLQDNWGRGNIKKFIQLKSKNPELKVLAAVGGWNEGSLKFSEVANDPIKRNRFVTSAVDFVKEHNFDGLDLDWEYPNQRHELATNDDKANFVTLIKELKEALSRNNLLLTAAVGSAEFSSSVSYNIPEVSKYLDIINVMAYDLHGSWDEVTGINAPLYEGPNDYTDVEKQLNVHASISYWLNNGAPREKIVLGMPFYGRTFTLADPNQHTVGSPHTGAGLPGQYSNEPGHIGYNEVCEKLQKEDWTYVWEDSQKVPYIYRGNQWIGFEDQRSIKLKAQYALDQGLAGVMIWSLESDDFHGNCGEKYILLKTIHSVLDGASYNKPTQSPIIKTTRVPAVTTKAPSSYECASDAMGYFRDPQECSVFYFCNGKTKYTFRCSPGLGFDTEMNGCNYIDQVNCNS
ncbi:acidic mammalian chitinase [Episyrphus balteatus]|uniref:acidic mammalian chitinase n=1 Tax=Episyrphus balteatus TaxID=286459 RepID=UPI0024851C95|nr:acidic mammalian chitinase [Episyrphus balteatus]